MEVSASAVAGVSQDISTFRLPLTKDRLYC